MTYGLPLSLQIRKSEFSIPIKLNPNLWGAEGRGEGIKCYLETFSVLSVQVKHISNSNLETVCSSPPNPLSS